MSGGNGELIQLKAKDFKSDQEVRWCPGCGDYAILNAVQGFMPELGIARERMVFVSGIGCAARFPYYMETYGMHSIHGRAPAIATGLATARRDLSVWVIGGDGDMLSIGGNHLIHALRRNVNLTILLLNNEIYGLTKGQYSPTSERGKVTKSTPMGSVDQPFNPLSVAIGAEATFVARAIDTDKKELTNVLRAAAAHRGASFVEIFQNCNIYNDGAFDFVREQKENRIYLREGEPIVFGDRGVRQAADGSAEVVPASEGGLLVHDPSHVEPSVAFALSRLTFETVGATPLGVFRSVERPVYDEEVADQIRRRPGAAGRRRPRGAPLERRHLADLVGLDPSRPAALRGRVSTSTETIDSGRSMRSPTSGHSPRGSSISAITVRASTSALSRLGAVPTWSTSPSFIRTTTRRSSDGVHSAIRSSGVLVVGSSTGTASSIVPGIRSAAPLQYLQLAARRSRPRPPEGLFGALDVDRDDRSGADEALVDLRPLALGGGLLDVQHHVAGDLHGVVTPLGRSDDDVVVAVHAEDHAPDVRRAERA